MHGTLDDIIVGAVRAAWETHGRNTNAAARSLGVSRFTMYRYLKKGTQGR